MHIKRGNETSFTDVDNTGSTTHTQQLGTLIQGRHTYDLQCDSTSDSATANVSFIMDTTAPSNVSINTSSSICSNSDLTATFRATDDNGLRHFNYSLVQDTNTVLPWTTTTSTQITRSASNLTPGTYTWRMVAVDNAGNSGQASNVNTVVYSLNDTRCDTIPPTITLNVINSVTQVGRDVEVTCFDAISGCRTSYEYNLLSTTGICVNGNQTRPYAQNLFIPRSSRVCVWARDNNDNLGLAQRVVDIPLNPACTNGQQDPGETGIDCGGNVCPVCDVGNPCTDDTDCLSLNCNNGACAAPSCTDGVRNGAETGIDCGANCPDCGIGQNCVSPNDCSSGSCSSAGKCITPSCDDNTKNQDETDVDCGGNACSERCEVRKRCNLDSDCKQAATSCGSKYVSCESGVCREDRNMDSDGDEIPDYWEVTYNLNPCDPSDAPEDFDKDNFENLEEYISGTDPNDPLDFPLNKKKSKTLPIILIILGVLAILGGAGYLAYKYYFVPEPEPEKSITPSSTQKTSPVKILPGAKQPSLDDIRKSEKEKLLYASRMRKRDKLRKKLFDAFNSKDVSIKEKKTDTKDVVKDATKVFGEPKKDKEKED